MLEKVLFPFGGPSFCSGVIRCEGGEKKRVTGTRSRQVVLTSLARDKLQRLIRKIFRDVIPWIQSDKTWSTDGQILARKSSSILVR